MRKDYKIKWDIHCGCDKYVISILPTIVVQPWYYRYVGASLIDIWWLNMHICIGEWIINPNSSND